MKTIYRILYVLIQLTWGCLQTALGSFIFLLNRKQEHFFYHGAIVTRWRRKTSLSLGLFLFVAENLDEERYAHILHHEFGHTIQSLILGPLYLVLIGIPSFVWCNLPCFRKLREKGMAYDAFFIESNASFMGRKILKNN